MPAVDQVENKSSTFFLMKTYSLSNVLENRVVFFFFLIDLWLYSFYLCVVSHYLTSLGLFVVVVLYLCHVTVVVFENKFCFALPCKYF